MARIFVVEDNESLREAVSSYLGLNDHEVVEFRRAEGLLEAVRTRPPALVVLDVMLPDADGFRLARRIRDASDIPIIFLTARTSESDRTTGLEIGADDYVVKPFSPRELVLRVEAVLRRTAKGAPASGGSGRWRLGEDALTLDPASHQAAVNQRPLKLTPAEWRILEYLAAHPGTVVDRGRLLGESLGYLIAEGSERTVDTHVKNLRAKLGSGEWIETVRGFGYRFTGRPAG